MHLEEQQSEKEQERREFTLVKDSVKYKVLAYLYKKGGTGYKEIDLMCRNMRSRKSAEWFEQEHLEYLKSHELVHKNVEGLWALTETGMNLIQPYVLKDGTQLTPARTIPIPRETYGGAELGKTCLRPGAYDAYSLPSVFGNQIRTPRNV